MFKIIAVLVLTSSFVFANNCDALYDRRGESLDVTLSAYDCYEKINDTDKLKNSSNLNKMAYLKFFQAAFFEDNRLNSLVKSFSLAKDAIKVYGPLFNKNDVKDLPAEQLEQITLGYYLYGTSVSKYVDLKGKWEAIKRMSEIKNTMKMILSLKKPETFHYGAYRTLAIFNLKVPKIAGGDIGRSRIFFEKLMKESKTDINVSSYPVSHIYYAEYLRIVGKGQEACAELNLVKSLTDQEIETYFKDLFYESIKDRALALETFEKYSC